MTVSREEIESMKRIMMAVNAVDTLPDAGGLPTSSPTRSSTGEAVEGTADMKRILESLERAGHSIGERSIHDDDLEEALYTNATPTGVSIKKYEIVIEDNGTTKRYRITRGGENIADDLLLYESAYAIVKLLNKGETILSPHVRKIIHLEESYASARNDAIHLRSHYQLNEGTAKGDILAAKYQKAKDNAVGYKTAIKNILKGM